jgi:translation initiation factor 2B subunit (eIF-2B alpha/beta/delta family)
MPATPSAEGLAATASAGASSAGEFSDAVARCIRDGDLDNVSDEQLRQVLTAALKLFAAKVESRGEHIDPVDAGQITPTEVVTMSAALLRTSGLNLFDLSMWLGRTR